MSTLPRWISDETRALLAALEAPPDWLDEEPDFRPSPCQRAARRPDLPPDSGRYRGPQ